MFKTHRTYDLSTGVKGNTLAVLNTGTTTAVVYHRTTVVLKRGRSVKLSNGGWDTVSTRIVINRALEQMAASACHLYREKGQTLLAQNGVIKPFISGMTIKVAHA